MSPLISLVLCTYNNADSLKITLAQLAAQQLDQPHLVEFIVINNNSSDHTQAVIEAADFHAFNYQFRVETRQGLSHARNLGVSLATGEYILFTDDDAEIPPHWLQGYLNHLQAKPVDSVFGKIEIIWDRPQPWWYDERYKGFFAAIDHGDEAFAVTSWRHPFFGKNFCVRKSIIGEIGGFDPNLGRKGTELLGGEETALFTYLLTQQKSIWYQPDISVGHRLKEREYSEENIKKQHIACAKPIIWFAYNEPGPQLFNRPIRILKDHLVFCLENTIAFIRALRKADKKEQFFLKLELRRSVRVIVYWLRALKP